MEVVQINKPRLQPMGRKVLIKMFDEDKVSQGGIHLPGNRSLNRFRKGEVMAIGKEVKYLSVGEKVAVNRFKADEHEIDGVTHQITEEDDIMFVWDGDDIHVDEARES